MWSDLGKRVAELLRGLAGRLDPPAAVGDIFTRNLVVVQAELAVAEAQMKLTKAHRDLEAAHVHRKVQELDARRRRNVDAIANWHPPVAT